MIEVGVKLLMMLCGRVCRSCFGNQKGSVPKTEAKDRYGVKVRIDLR